MLKLSKSSGLTKSKPMKKSNQEETRQHNSRLVLNTIYHSGEISRVEIARRTQLTRTTVSAIVAEFLETGLVVETGLAPSTGGKPATLLRVDEHSRLIVGVDLTEREFRGALVNLRGEVIEYSSLPIEADNGDAALELVYKLIEQLLQLADRLVIGIGIGVPGLMDPSTGSVRQAVNLDWQDLPLGDLLHQRFDLPIHLANDCQVAALGEFTFGSNQNTRNLIVIKAGRGIGAGIVLNGQLFYGDGAGAGEIGHTQVVEAGLLCRCGNLGCLETLVSNHALVDQGHLIAPDMIIDFSSLLLAYQKGNAQVISLVEKAADTLGRSITHLVSALNINRILIAGNLSRFGRGLIDPICRQVQKGVLPVLSQQTEVAAATLGEDIVILGAASLILKNELGLF